MKNSIPSLSDFHFRPARFPEDTARIREIVGAVWHGGGDAIIESRYGRIGDTPWQEWQARDVLQWIQAANAHAFVVGEAADVIGFCSFQIDRERSFATVGYNAVSPDHQGRGIGSLMMQWIMDRIHESGVDFAGVLVADNEAHAPARRVYEKHGFQTVYGLKYMVRKR